MLRLFTALEIPPHMAQILANLQNDIPDARWVSAQSFHITLRYIGAVEESAVREIEGALSSIIAPVFSVALKNVGSFGKLKPRALWAGIEPNAELEALYQQIDKSLACLGFPSARKVWTPHITLARLKASSRAQKRALELWLKTHGLFHAEPFEAERFILFSSHSQSENLYVPERVYQLTNSKTVI